MPLPWNVKDASGRELKAGANVMTPEGWTGKVYEVFEGASGGPECTVEDGFTHHRFKTDQVRITSEVKRKMSAPAAGAVKMGFQYGDSVLVPNVLSPSGGKVPARVLQVDGDRIKVEANNGDVAWVPSAGVVKMSAVKMAKFSPGDKVRVRPGSAHSIPGNEGIVVAQVPGGMDNALGYHVKRTDGKTAWLPETEIEKMSALSAGAVKMAIGYKVDGESPATFEEMMRDNGNDPALAAFLKSLRPGEKKFYDFAEIEAVQMSARGAGAVKMANIGSVRVGEKVGYGKDSAIRGVITSVSGKQFTVDWGHGNVSEHDATDTSIVKMSALSARCPGCKHSAPVTFGRIEKHLNLNKAVVCAGSGHKVKMGNGGFSVGDKVRHANGVTGTVSGDAASGLLYVKTDDGSGYLGTKIMNPKDLVKMSAPAARGVKMAAGDSTFADIARRHGATSIDETSTGGWLGAKFRDKASADRFADDVASGIGKRPNVSDAPGGFGFWVQVKMSAPASQAVR